MHVMKLNSIDRGNILASNSTWLAYMLCPKLTLHCSLSHLLFCFRSVQCFSIQTHRHHHHHQCMAAIAMPFGYLIYFFHVILLYFLLTVFINNKVIGAFHESKYALEMSIGPSTLDTRHQLLHDTHRHKKANQTHNHTHSFIQLTNILEAKELHFVLFS